MLGFIGLLNIPLDMMTIAIAAITMGIVAMNNSIHYIYRFKYEKENINGDKQEIANKVSQSVEEL